MVTSVPLGCKAAARNRSLPHHINPGRGLPGGFPPSFSLNVKLWIFEPWLPQRVYGHLGAIWLWKSLLCAGDQSGSPQVGSLLASSYRKVNSWVMSSADKYIFACIMHTINREMLRWPLNDIFFFSNNGIIIGFEEHVNFQVCLTHRNHWLIDAPDIFSKCDYFSMYE